MSIWNLDAPDLGEDHLREPNPIVKKSTNTTLGIYSR